MSTRVAECARSSLERTGDVLSAHGAPESTATTALDLNLRPVYQELELRPAIAAVTEG